MMYQRALDQFECLYEEAAERPKVMAIAIHPYISGQPHRIRYLEEVYETMAAHDGVVHMNGAELLRWWQSR